MIESIDNQFTISKNSTNENESMSHYAEIGASIDSVEDSPQEKEQVQKTDISKEETNSELQDANTEIIYQELERDFHISLKFDKKAIIDLIKISDYDIVTIKNGYSINTMIYNDYILCKIIINAN